MSDYAQKLDDSLPLPRPVLRQALAALDLAPGGQGIDLGCGTGGVTQLLASAVSPGGCWALPGSPAAGRWLERRRVVTLFAVLGIEEALHRLGRRLRLPSRWGARGSGAGRPFAPLARRRGLNGPSTGCAKVIKGKSIVADPALL